ncbi:hypothetical protein [Ensifer soli]|uniref:hypothetical protein n=1 Tax=Ciceribacter sp. sgz301302 TaxID=3342379 RepID=UPI0035B8D222
MSRALVLAATVFLSAVPALAQDTVTAQSSSSGRTLRDVLSDGYEIRAASANGTNTILFLQKEKSAYACEFVTVTRSRCGKIN